MAWIIGDSFDWYTNIADAAANFWDAAVSHSFSASGRFAGSQCLVNGLSNATTIGLSKVSGSNDATHHIALAFRQTTALSGTTNIFWITLYDGTTAQCTIVFRSDGTILLTSGASSGSTLATYSSAFIQNTWAAFEFEITINNTTGVFKVRKDGAGSDSHSTTSLNTRGGTANNYANKLAIGSTSTSFTQNIDDFLWFSTSGAAPNTWVGDVRAVQLLPISNSGTTQFTGSLQVGTPNAVSSTTSRASGVTTYRSFVATYSGTVPSGTFMVSTGGTGNVKVALYDASNGGNPGTALATSSAIVNPTTGTQPYTFSSPPTIVKGTTYYMAFDQDFTVIYTAAGGASGINNTTAYGSFPATNPGSFSTLAVCPFFTLNITTTNNSELVMEAIHNDTTDYVYDSTTGHLDFYNLGSLSYTPASVLAVQTRAYMCKSDTGARTGAIQMKSGTITNSATLSLSTSWQHLTRVDLLDPNTGVAWAAAAVNAITVGPSLTA